VPYFRTPAPQYLGPKGRILTVRLNNQIPPTCIANIDPLFNVERLHHVNRS